LSTDPEGVERKKKKKGRKIKEKKKKGEGHGGRIYSASFPTDLEDRVRKEQ